MAEKKYRLKLSGDYKGKTLKGKIKEFVKTAGKQNIGAAKKIAKGISGGAKKIGQAAARKNKKFGGSMQITGFGKARKR
jgi:hypothetical protein